MRFTKEATDFTQIKIPRVHSVDRDPNFEKIRAQARRSTQMAHYIYANARQVLSRAEGTNK